jgi:hypothetical protein
MRPNASKKFDHEDRRVPIANFPSARVTILREFRNQGRHGQIFDLRSVLDLNLLSEIARLTLARDGLSGPLSRFNILVA